MKQSGVDTFRNVYLIPELEAIFNRLLHILELHNNENITVACYAANNAIPKEIASLQDTEYEFTSSCCVITYRDRKIVLLPMVREKKYQRDDVENAFFSVVQLYSHEHQYSSMGPMTHLNVLEMSEYLVTVLESPYYHYSINTNLFNPAILSELED